MGDAVLERKVSEGVWKGGDFAKTPMRRLGAVRTSVGRAFRGEGTARAQACGRDVRGVFMDQ